MKASILAIGDELVGGLTVDTNSGWLAQLLQSVGIEVTGVQTVPDDEDAIILALFRALEGADLCITTGGLGPTIDDLTSACVARFAGRELALHAPSLDRIEQRFRDRGLEMPPNNRKQALLPSGATVIPNPTGTAPGFLCPVEGGRWIATLPGVPREMKRMAEETLLPWLAERGGGGMIAARVYSTFGLTESRLDELLSDVVAEGEARLAFRAAFPRLQLRVTVTGASAAAAEARLDAIEPRIRERLGDALYAVGDVGLEAEVGRLLREHSLTLATAESCTGGLIGHRLTDVPGSSASFLMGVTAYANEAKQAVLVEGESGRDGDRRWRADSPGTAEPRAMAAPRISVVVPTCRRKALLERCLGAGTCADPCGGAELIRSAVQVLGAARKALGDAVDVERLGREVKQRMHAPDGLVDAP